MTTNHHTEGTTAMFTITAPGAEFTTEQISASLRKCVEDNIALIERDRAALAVATDDRERNRLARRIARTEAWLANVAEGR